MRDSYEALRSLCLSPASVKWLSALENTQWINYISLILKVCVYVCMFMFVCVCVFMFMLVCVCMYVCLCVCVYVCMFMFVCVCVTL